MRNNVKKIFAGILTGASLLVFGSVLIRAVWYFPSDEIEISEEIQSFIPQKALANDTTPVVVKAANSSTKAAYSMRLQIPKLDVDAKIKYVGITKSGNMATPGNLTDVGLYKYGAMPGQKGSAVIAGHVNNGFALPGVFKNLNNLKKGDEVYVKTTEGENPIRFVVTGTAVYDFDEKVEKIWTEDHASILRLITCTGKFVKEYGTHDKRLVVTAVREA